METVIAAVFDKVKMLVIIFIIKYNYSMVNISASIPEQLKLWIETQISAGFYSSTSDYLRDLIRNDQAHKEQLDMLLLEGLQSGEGIEPDADFWERKKNQFKQ